MKVWLFLVIVFLLVCLFLTILSISSPLYNEHLIGLWNVTSLSRVAFFTISDLFFFSFSVSSVALYLHFATSVIHEITTALGIYCFRWEENFGYSSFLFYEIENSKLLDKIRIETETDFGMNNSDEDYYYFSHDSVL